MIKVGIIGGAGYTAAQATPATKLPTYTKDCTEKQI